MNVGNIPVQDKIAYQVAALPELIEALEQCEYILDDMERGGAENPELSVVRRALAKANQVDALPELIEALEQCEYLLHDMEKGGAENPELAVVRRALAKAKGKVSVRCWIVRRLCSDPYFDGHSAAMVFTDEAKAKEYIERANGPLSEGDTGEPDYYLQEGYLE